MPDAALVQKLDDAWGDPDAWTATGLKWIHVPEVRAHIRRRVSGDPGLPRLPWFARRVGERQPLPFDRVLVIGCGTDGAEIELIRLGLAREVVAFDLSARGVAAARAQAAAYPGITHVQADMNDLPVGTAPFEPGSFDAAVAIASVHHCAELDRLFDAVRALLVPGGWFLLDEYIGPERFQYDAEELRHVERIASLLPPPLLTTRAGVVRRGFRAPSVEEVIAVDPSEAVNSSSILGTLARHFTIDRVRPYGGAALHLLLADVAQNYGTEEARAWLRSVLRAEDDLLAQGALSHHFACAIARSPAPSTTARTSAANAAAS